MSMRIVLLAVALFMLVYLTDTTKSLRQKGGRSIVAALLLSVNVLAEMKQLSALSQQLSQYNVDKLYNVARDIVHAFGLSTSSLISLQMFLASAMAMFALLFNCQKSNNCVVSPEFVEKETKRNQNQKECDASKVYVMRRVVLCAKMRN